MFFFYYIISISIFQYVLTKVTRYLDYMYMKTYTKKKPKNILLKIRKIINKPQNIFLYVILFFCKKIENIYSLKHEKTHHITHHNTLLNF